MEGGMLMGYSRLAAISGITLLVLVVAVGATDCGKPLDQCDFYFKGYDNNVPLLRLKKKGDTKYWYAGTLVHKIGSEKKEVTTANSNGCAVESPKDLKSYDKDKCHERLYMNGNKVWSREFNIGTESDYLRTCIKVFIKTAQYADGTNYNDGGKAKDCAMVETHDTFGRP